MVTKTNVLKFQATTNEVAHEENLDITTKGKLQKKNNLFK